MSSDDAKPRPIRNSTPGYGTLTRCYKAVCAVCKRTEIVDGHDKDHDAEPQLRDRGWKETTRLTEDDRRHWICPKHHEPGSYKVFLDKNDARHELGPGDVGGLG
jgi:O-methyltransferase involved in polyketide biosynthesis